MVEHSSDKAETLDRNHHPLPNIKEFFYEEKKFICSK